MLIPGDEYYVLYESASDLRYSQNFAGRIDRVNRMFERVLGVSRASVVGASIYEWIGPEFREAYRQRILEHIGGAPALPMEIEMIGTRGAIPVELSLELVFNTGKPVGVHATGRDLTDQVRSRIERAAVDLTLMRQTEELATFSRYLQLLHRLSTTTYNSLDDLYADYLSTGCQIFRLECAAIVELVAEGLVIRRTCGKQEAGVVENLARQILESEETAVGPLPGSGMASASFRAGTPLRSGEELLGVLLFWSGSSNHTHPQAREMIEMMARGIESAVQQKKLTAELEFRAHHDGLTGLVNRGTFIDRVDSALRKSRRQHCGVAVIYIDLDRFKEINDELGHAAGDAALRGVADRFRESVPPGVLLARLGGDELAALVPELRRTSEALEIAGQLLGALTRPFLLMGQERHLTASCGVSVHPESGDDAESLLRKADQAMYEGKQSGGNQIRTARLPG